MVLRLTEEEPVLRRTTSSLPVRLLVVERPAPVLPVMTRTEELRPDSLSARRVSLLPVRLDVAPVRDELAVLRPDDA